MEPYKTLKKAYAQIKHTHHLLQHQLEQGKSIPPAGEWLLDNFYALSQQEEPLRRALRRPLKNLPGGKTPDVASLSSNIVYGGYCHITQSLIEDYVGQFQKERPLSSRELSMLSPLLLLFLLEKVAGLCEELEKSAAAMKNAAWSASFPVTDEILIKFNPQGINDTYFEALTQLLKRDPKKNEGGLKAIDTYLAAREMKLEDICAREYERQAKYKLELGEAITSFFAALSLPWGQVLEKLSIPEQLLLSEPRGVYPTMDSSSRLHYRRALEEVSRRSGASERHVAQMCLELADKKQHVGYYLLGEGKAQLYSALGAAPPKTVKNKSRLYLFTIFLLTAALCLALAAFHPVGALLSLFPLMGIVLSLTRFVLTHTVRPAFLPKLDPDKLDAVPTALVVIPTLLTDPEQVEEVFSSLESHYCANRQGYLRFALAGDFPDRKKQEPEQEAAITAAALSCVERLNRRWGDGVFYYFHRRQIYLEKEKKYMGWERKRGALLELVRLLEGETDTTYETVSAMPPKISYVVTLDLDTVPTKDSIKKLLGAMLHPLSHPFVDPDRMRVTRGYAILQPRMSIDLESANASVFSRIFAGQGGIDPYSSVISDVYQDVFGEGTFMGKGIFDVGVYHALLDGRFPDGSVLSHDLLEGSYLRCGFVSDVEWLDGYPARYGSYASRQERWTRGDWQLVPWLGGMVATARGKEKNPLSTLAKWKIFDNLRRSLHPAFALLLLLASFWTLPPIFFAVSALSLVMPAVESLLDWLRCANYRYVGQKQFVPVLYGLKATSLQLLLSLALLPHQAYLGLKGAALALVRRFVTHRGLLDWVTAAQSEKAFKNRCLGYYRSMAVSPIVGAACFLMAYLRPGLLLFQVGFGAAWILSPYIAWAISRPFQGKSRAISGQGRRYLSQLCRKTWAYFEDTLTEENHFLPPDNVQLSPYRGQAQRTSPTNIGLALVSLLLAYRMGYVTKLRFTHLLCAMLDTIARLPKWNGHLYNWYSTRDCSILPPAYVSTVDSGNLAGDLYAVRQALPQVMDEPFFANPLSDGLAVTASLCGLSLPQGPVQSVTPQLISQLGSAGADAFWLKKLMAMAEDIQLQAERPGAQEECRGKLKWALGQVERLIRDMDFSPLYDRGRGLLSIGYNVSAAQRTPSCYDLLASEARCASYIAIAKGDVPVSHWFHLSRTLVQRGGYRGLVSWSGTMFEYFMPALLMRPVPHSLLDETYHFVLSAQMRYGKNRSVPWGISECAYAAFDQNKNYRYFAFGVEQLALRRAKEHALVVAPYASQLALMQNPEAAIANLKALEALGAGGRYGFYDAVDFTPEHQLHGKHYTVVKTHMVHHLGMGFLAMANALYGGCVQELFHKNPEIRSCESLLQENVPTGSRAKGAAPMRRAPQPLSPYREEPFSFCAPDTCQPHLRLLSNSTFCTMMDDMGRGYSKQDKAMVTRWRDYFPSSFYGSCVYLSSGGQVWSGAPAPVENGDYQRTFSSSYVCFQSVHGQIETQYQVTVSPEDSLEVRRLELVNRAKEEKKVRLISYLEPALCDQNADEAHMAFGKLFLSTAYDPERCALYALRRPREKGELPLCAFHKFLLCPQVDSVSYETSRERFIGRGRTLKNPAILKEEASNFTGAAVDPVLSFSATLTLPPEGSAQVYFISGAAPSLEGARLLLDKYSRAAVAGGAFSLAAARSGVVGNYLSLTAEEERLFQRMLSFLIYPNQQKPSSSLRSGAYGVEDLWKWGVSGDVPIVAYRAEGSAYQAALLLRAHRYWRLRGLECDMVFLALETDQYHRPIHHGLQEEIDRCHGREMLGQRGGVFLLDREAEGAVYAACSLFFTDLCPIGDQLSTRPPALSSLGALCRQEQPLPRPKLLFDNGFGGFDGTDYVICLEKGKNTPLPWSNVVANRRFGFLITERGGGYSWYGNSRQCKLTPWSNDPILDPPGELLYLRDREKGTLWPLLPYEGGSYQVRHGLGYSSFLHVAGGVQSLCTLFVPQEDPVKIIRIHLKNLTSQPRELSVIHRAYPVLGDKMRPRRIVTSFEQGCAVARSVFGPKKEQGVRLFLASFSPNPVYGGIQTPPLEFSGLSSSGWRPMLHLESHLTLPPEGEIQVNVLLGAAEDEAEMVTLKERYACQDLSPTPYDPGLYVTTPDPAFDLMVNGRLLYQAHHCRMLARCGFYQTSGAFGFRDQLQDCAALCWSDPAAARAQILLHASRQFPQGDVLHWWHEGDGEAMGIRTRFRDDFLWLPYVACLYAQRTGDSAIFQATAPYLEGPMLEEGQQEAYGVYRPCAQEGTLLEHCLRAVDFGARFGRHGLPLMGCGDWNDGMNRVGKNGQGESVWLGFFLYHVMERLLPHIPDALTVSRYEERMRQLAEDLNGSGWDGQWFRRAYFDDGTPLGSLQSPECSIDSIAQSWAALSGAAEEEKAKSALSSAYTHLVRREEGMSLLLFPPFDAMEKDPGYIKSYLPGVRENGGQYTHGAVWLAMAFAKMKNAATAYELAGYLNPISHSIAPEKAARYKAEPYAVAADLYSAPPHVGRGGWTWYTGAAGWMYQLYVEWILGFHKEGNIVSFRCPMPPGWDGFTLQYRFGSADYYFHATCADAPQVQKYILVDDGQPHHIPVELERTPEKG